MKLIKIYKVCSLHIEKWVGMHFSDKFDAEILVKLAKILEVWDFSNLTPHWQQ